MSVYDFETELMKHCSPAILGIKPSNLISFPKDRWWNIHAFIEKYQQIFLKYGIRMKVVCSCKKHFLILVYNDELLQNYIGKYSIRSFLNENGYSQCNSCEEFIEHLALKYGENQNCPDEIGIFLGYPLADVKGFIQHKGNQCKYCGIWKVYDDVSYAMKMFAKYKKCNENVQKAMANGYRIVQILEQKEMIYQGGC